MKYFIARKLISYPAKELIGYALIDEDKLDEASLTDCCKSLISTVNWYEYKSEFLEDEYKSSDLESAFKKNKYYLFSDYSKMEMWCAINGYEHSQIKDKLIADDLNDEEIDAMIDLYEKHFGEDEDSIFYT